MGARVCIAMMLAFWAALAPAAGARSGAPRDACIGNGAGVPACR